MIIHISITCRSLIHCALCVPSPTLVGGRQPLAQSSGDVDPLVRRDTPDASQKRGEILSIHVLHGQERLATGRADVVYAAHVRVRYLPGESHLVAESRQRRRRFRNVGGEKLERDGLLEGEGGGPGYLAHTTRPQIG